MKVLLSTIIITISILLLSTFFSSGHTVYGSTFIVTPTPTPTPSFRFVANPTPTPSTYKIVRKTSPARSEVYRASDNTWVATFTDNSYTVTLKGSPRTFSEPEYTTYTVSHSTWVRVLSAPFNGTVDEKWLTEKLNDTSPDILALSIQYIFNAPARYNNDGLMIADDADYGPVQADGTLQEGSDFNDYLGLDWEYPGDDDQNEEHQIGSLDCSGYMRMIWGYRSGIPMTFYPNGKDMPRRSFEIYESAPGVITIPNTGVQVTDFSKLSEGDLVFFDQDSGDGPQLDHVGMYLGRDSGGNYRFISSRKTVNGPTLGDVGGRSTLNGTAGYHYYATAFRSARRL